MFTAARRRSGDPRRGWRRLLAWLDKTVGGAANRRVILLLAAVLGLDNADLATIGAVGSRLKADLHMSNSELGLAAAASAIVGALATVPMGIATDRVRRVRLLAGSVALWAVAMVACGSSPSLVWLVVSRLALGGVTATAAPVLASLSGDYFKPGERARMYGYILSGELLGGGFGFAASGNIAAATSWRVPFFVLAAVSAALAWALWRWLPEPRRRSDPLSLTFRQAARYVLRIRTNVLLIVASAVGYFFFAGLRTFGVVFVANRFGVGQAGATTVLFVAGLGSLGGVLLGGRLSDRLLERGRVDARVVTGAAAFAVAAVVLVPALVAPSLAIAAPLMFVGAAALAMPNPPLDAARLDIVPSGLWGRAESVRALLRNTAQGVAPLVFGVVADAFGGSGSRASGLEYAFLVMLVPLALNGAIVYRARRTYPDDVAAAEAADGQSSTSSSPIRPSPVGRSRTSASVSGGSPWRIHERSSRRSTMP